MKAKTIKSVLRKKIDDWLASIEDEELRELCRKNTIVTGGCIASMLLGEKVNDFDIYFTNKETVLAVANYYVTKFIENPPTRFKDGGKCVPIYVIEEGDRVKIKVQSAGIVGEQAEDEYQYFEQTDPESTDPFDYVDRVMDVAEATNEKPKYRPIFLSSNAITLSNDIQIVIRFYGDAETIHKNYDFVHCTNYWTSKDNVLTRRQEALECLLARELKYMGSKYPICSVIRTRKFLRRGWSITAGQYLKMAMQISELDLEDIHVLEDQLTGVDVFYFLEVLEALKEKGTERVDRAYLCEIIDRMF